jgi:Lipopolysaccharide kinase (Kdo/WaaP) family
VIWRMSLMDGVSLARGGWTFVLPGYDARFSETLREEFIDAALAAADGVLPTRIRRSRHAETWRERIGGEHGPSVYFKVLDPPRGTHLLKRLLRGSRVAHVASISQWLRRDGLDVAEIVLIGAEDRGGRELIATARVEGTLLPRHIRSLRQTLAAKRAMLHALGHEVARFHRAGYIHGDLTPYNILVTGVDPPRFAFIDHERTRRTWLSRFERPRLRNLVQLGHFDLQMLTNTDRMRVWCGYSAAMPRARRNHSLRRLLAMLQARGLRDRKPSRPGETVIARRSEAEER